METVQSAETLESNPDAATAALRMLKLESASRAPLIQELNEDGTVAEEPAHDSESDEDPSLMEEMLAAAEEARKSKAESKAKEERRLKKSFGVGFKKGFLSSGSTTKKSRRRKNVGKQTPKSEVPTVVSNPEEKEASLRLPEVQSAMRESMGPLKAKLSEGAWMTPELMERIQESPRLSAALANPSFGALLSRMQHNPSEVTKELKDSPETQALLNEFMMLMGKHFEALGAKEDAATEAAKEKQSQMEMAARGPLATKILAEEEARKKGGGGNSLDQMSERERRDVEEHLQNPEVRQLLMDETLQRVLVEASTDPAAFQRAMQSDELSRKIRRMAQLGLVQLQQ